ncbi:MAG TPA: uracil-DNA glycosylase [Candidatus Eisenbacteria bacterium]|jgi:DNA polymerase|nr:uracil-DNA glycosylase [Candidatus Eisenbacteria bacterium]
MNPETAGLRKLVRQALETERAFGIDEIQRPAEARADVAAPGAVSADKASALAALKEKFKDCRFCALSETRTQVVFGAGNPDARLLFVGEAPGYDEDIQGEPFVGAAGQLLTKIIQAMRLKREDVYIANCLKCRPPQNRSPLPTEIVSCQPILLRQIEIIRPEIICALGKFAAQTLLATDTPISRLRGHFHDFRGIRLMPTFHPAYLLRNPEDKKLVWEDAQKIMKELGL